MLHTRLVVRVSGGNFIFLMGMEVLCLIRVFVTSSLDADTERKRDNVEKKILRLSLLRSFVREDGGLDCSTIDNSPNRVDGLQLWKFR